jgi:DNA invertase Pin-like site-specific DNA recombinase
LSAHPFPPGSHIFAYLRDSGHEQQDLSIPQQETSLTEWARANGLILSHVYKDVAKPGSTTTGRSALQQMMHAFRHGCPEMGVVVWSYSRFSRNIDDALIYRTEIRSLGYIFFSLNDNVPEGPMGRIFEAIIDYKNQQHLVDMSLDIQRALRDLVTKYGCVPGTPPRGFKREPVAIGKRRDGSPHLAHRWVPDPDVVPLIQQAFEMRAAGQSLNAINAATGLFSTLNSYRTFWGNQLYIGTLQFGELTVENYCAPLISPDTWQAVQQRQNYFTRRRHLSNPDHPADHPRRVNSRFLLSGLLRCALCDSPLAGHTSTQRSKNRVDSYLCPQSRRRQCAATRIPAEAVEQAVLRTVRDFVLLPDNLAALTQFHLADQTLQAAQNESQRKTLLDRLQKTRAKLKRTAAAIAESGHSRTLLETLSTLELQETDLLTQIARLQDALPPQLITHPELLRRARVILHLLEQDDFETKRLILRGLIEKITVIRAGNLVKGEIIYYYPPLDLGSPGGPSEPSNPSPTSDPPTPTPRAVPLSHNPPGAPRYRHSTPFSISVLEFDKRYKKSRSS